MPLRQSPTERKTLVKTRFILLLSLAAACLSGCAGTRIATPQVAPWVQSASFNRTNKPIPSPRHTPSSDQILVVNRIDERINPAAIRICQRTFNNPQDCFGLLRSRKIRVLGSDSRINAFVGDKYDITFLGGLIFHAGSDDEIASVLAHEYSHALLGHPQKSMRNRLGGMLIGMAIGAAVGAKTENPDWVDLGARVGFETGNLVFSRSMELEADHLGMFILHEAGYDMSSATDFHVRMRNYEARGESTGIKGLLGFITTHPPPERRIDKMIATQAQIEAGAQRPSWKKK